MITLNNHNKKVTKKNIPLGIVIDRSQSTEDIQELLNNSIRSLVSELRKNEELCNQVEILAIHYNEQATVVTEFTPLSQLESTALDIRCCDGATNTGQALLTAIDKLRAFEMLCKGRRERCTTPLLFLFTDGYPDPGQGAPAHIVSRCQQLYQNAASSIKSMEQNNSLYFCAAGIQQTDGSCADMEQLKLLTNHPDRIICVDNSETGANSIMRFCDMIRETAIAMSSASNPENVVHAFFDL